MRQGRERLGQLVADASHAGGCQLRIRRAARQGGLGDPEAENKAAWSRIEQKIKRMGTLIEELLMLARLGQGSPARDGRGRSGADLRDAAADHATIDRTRSVELTGAVPESTRTKGPTPLAMDLPGAVCVRCLGRGGAMEVVDLSDGYVRTYLACLEDWSDEMAEAGDHKARWYESMKDRGLRVKLALDEERRAVGMIQYLPIEQSIAEGEDLYMVLCIWVHAYPQGVGDHRGHGIGSALLAAAEADAEQLGAKGLAAWGITLPFWMRSSWFKKHGYESADRSEGRELVWKRFSSDAEPPRWVGRGPTPEPVEGQVTMTAFLSGWCPAMNLTYERSRRVAEDLGDPVVFVPIDTGDPAAIRRHGHADVVFLDGKKLQRGAPPSYEKIRRKTNKRVRRLHRC